MNQEQKISLPTQQFLEIESIDNDLVKLRSGGLRKILLVSGINFELKSEEEQSVILYAFQGLINSLDFSAQFFIHSRKLNIEDYLEKLTQKEYEEPNELLKNQITEYKEFIKTFVSQNAIMEKNFFVVIPYDPVQIPKAGMAVTDKIKNIFGFKAAPVAIEKTSQEKTEQLNQRVDEITSGLNQVGLRAVPLNNKELKELFFNLYNPETTEKKDIAALQEAKN